jgi:hypothetical protein
LSLRDGCRFSSVAEFFLVEFDPMLAEECHEFLVRGAVCMVLFLRLNVTHDHGFAMARHEPEL